VSVPSGFIISVAERHFRDEISREEAITELQEVLGVHRNGAEELLDSAISDLNFLYEDDE
jgi:hypothetical protein